MEGKILKGLSIRLLELLEQCIEDYIKTAVPISSGVLSAKPKIARSSATVRNELKTLEEMGFLKQVHTSGGRIPTTQGYRVYVDRIMDGLNLRPGELSLAAEQIGVRTQNLPGIIDEVCAKLSKTVDYPFVVRQQFDTLLVQDIKVVPLVGAGTLVLIKTSAGSLNQTIDLEGNLNECDYDDASAALSNACVGLTLRRMLDNLPNITKAIKKNLVFFETLCRQLSEKLEQVVERNLSRQMNLVKLLDIPDYQDIERVKKLGHVIESDETLSRVLESGDNVMIGDEIDAPDLSDSSVIKFDYKIGGDAVLRVGIIGPERMDYKTLIGALHSLMRTTEANRKIRGGNSPPKLE